MGKGALQLIGRIYAILGSAFLVLGLFLTLLFRQEAASITGYVFLLVGGLFALLGGIFLLIEYRKRKRADRLLAAGRYIWGEVVDVVPNFNIRINGRNPYILMVCHMDSQGTAHIFKSPSLHFYREPSLVGKQVKVYISDDTFREYYVDTEGILPRMVEH